MLCEVLHSFENKVCSLEFKGNRSDFPKYLGTLLERRASSTSSRHLQKFPALDTRLICLGT